MASKLQISIDLSGSAGLYLQRILGLKPKRRISKRVYIEEDLLEILEKNNPDVELRYGNLSDTVNLGLIYVMSDQGLIK